MASTEEMENSVKSSKATSVVDVDQKVGGLLCYIFAILRCDILSKEVAKLYVQYV